MLGWNVQINVVVPHAHVQGQTVPRVLFLSENPKIEPQVLPCRVGSRSGDHRRRLSVRKDEPPVVGRLEIAAASTAEPLCTHLQVVRACHVRHGKLAVLLMAGLLRFSGRWTSKLDARTGVDDGSQAVPYDRLAVETPEI